MKWFAFLKRIKTHQHHFKNMNGIKEIVNYNFSPIIQFYGENRKKNQILPNWSSKLWRRLHFAHIKSSERILSHFYLCQSISSKSFFWHMCAHPPMALCMPEFFAVIRIDCKPMKVQSTSADCVQAEIESLFQFGIICCSKSILFPASKYADFKYFLLICVIRYEFIR